MLDQLTNWSLHPGWTCAAITLVMALESAPFIGFLLPGGTTLVAIGALSGAGLSDFVDALLCATAGSLLGDSLGYWLGLAWLKRHALANFCPDDLAELQATARNKLKSAQHRPSIIAACWKQADLF